MATDTSAIRKIADDILRAVELKISENNRAYVTNALKNYRVDGSHIQRETLGNIHIKDASIDKAKVKDFVSEVAQIAVAEIASATIDTAQIDNLSAYVADITMATIETAEIDWAQIANLTATVAAIATAEIGSARIGFAQIDGLTAGVALIQEAVGDKVQIADLSVTDANIVELNANKITAGTLSVERLVIIGGTQSIVYTINEANGTAQLSQNTIDGGSLTQRSISADRIVAGTITGDEIAAETILANNIGAGAITTDKIAAGAVTAHEIEAGTITANEIQTGSITVDKVSSDFGGGLDLSSNKSITFEVLKNGLSSILEQTEEKLTLRFLTPDGPTGYIDFDAEGIKIGTVGSEITTQFRQSRISFFKGETEIAYFEGYKLYVTAAEILNRLSIGASPGGFLDIVTTQQGVGFKWRTV